MSAVLLACRVVIVLVLLASLVSRARDPRGFVGAVTEFELFPAAWSPPVAALVAVAEVASIVLIVLPATAGAGLLLAALLFAAFGLGVARLLLRGQAVDCHCFGATRPSARWTPVGRNLVLIGFCLTGVALALVGGSSPVPGMTTFGVVVIALVAASLLVRAEDLADVLATPRVAKP